MAIPVNEIPGKANVAFADITDQLPSEYGQDHRYLAHFFLVFRIEQE
jgi:hypothetical protein